MEERGNLAEIVKQIGRKKFGARVKIIKEKRSPNPGAEYPGGYKHGLLCVVSFQGLTHDRKREASTFNPMHFIDQVLGYLRVF